MHHRFVVTLTIAFAAVGLDARAGSPSKPDREALKARCSGDYATYCGDLPPDGPEVQACFRKNMADLSPACRTEIGRHERGGRKG
ncbi:hypothetical protein [Methylobacterium dankookense]|jgi:hypothetical protein|uniref:3',5'-cyclic-nucleotide phosphodiesterase n=1 Tax=Methylobacterium dankookense TaxID=560405 RepID=A0A564G410_9HYPH|nr:hypothetical protein [Methylobacterium dankookense]GJD58903.1 hypothetical protein IFDJLNFL_4829 [Methylobacterium dankookense]VUF15243.1 hypothetical protein MTDSW087_04979 [Methylobacterium dankookense]